MSVEFFIEDTKYKGTLTLGQMVEIGENISHFDGFDKYSFHKINQYVNIFLGQKGKSAMGFELSYKSKRKSYCIKLDMPCSTGDFQVVFDYIKKLCAFLGTNIVLTKKDEEYTPDNIEEYPYREQIMSCLKQTMRAFKRQKEPDTIEFLGANRAVSFNEKMFTEIMNSNDPVKEFSDFITSIQNINAVTPRQSIHLDSYIGVYTLTETVRTILPYKPVVDERNKQIFIREDMIDYWDLNLVVIEGDPADIKSYRVLGSIKYSEFIKKLPKDKYHFIDASYIIVDGLSREEIENFLKN